MFLQLVLWASFLYFVYTYLKPKRPTNFPPGPFGYPIIGYSSQFFGLDPVLAVGVQKFGQEHGPVSGVKLGRSSVVIVNGWAAVKEVLTRDEFQNRPQLQFGQRENGIALGLMFSNGEFWKDQRRFSMRQLRDFGFGKTSIESVIQEELAECIQEIKEAARQTAGSTAWLNNTFGVSLINVLWAVMAGRRFSHSDAKFKEILVKLNESFRQQGTLNNLINDWPFLRHFPVFSTVFKGSNEATLAVSELLKDTIEEHERTRSPESPRDFIDTYLNEIASLNEKGVSNPYFSKRQLAVICSDLFGAGGESTSNSVSFGMLYMILYPEVQTKVQEELERVIGPNRLPSYADKPNLPYTVSVMMELLRMSNIAPLTVPHTAAEDTRLHGYDIPKGTTVMVNLYSVTMDLSYWGDPETFRPDRFLDADGNVVKSERLIPFGMGKRACPGESLAQMTYFLFFTTMLQTFRLELDPDSPRPSTVPISGFTVTPQPFKARITARAPEK